MPSPFKAVWCATLAFCLAGSPSWANAAEPSIPKIARLIGVALPELSTSTQVSLCREPIHRWTEYRLRKVMQRAGASASYEPAKVRKELAELRDYDMLLLEAWGAAAAAERGSFTSKLAAPKNDRALLKERVGLTDADVARMSGISNDQAYQYWAPICAGIVQDQFLKVVKSYYAFQKLRRALPSREADKAAGQDIRIIEMRRAEAEIIRQGIM